jgi:hypothetical protein
MQCSTSNGAGLRNGYDKVFRDVYPSLEFRNNITPPLRPKLDNPNDIPLD